jgi:membrane protein DedA with SNARE-associated domain
MLHLAEQDLTGLLAHYGYLAVVVLIGLESMGVPLPGETMLITAAIYAGSTHRLNIGLVILAAVAGAILGDNLGYLIGREGGFRLLRRYGHRVGISEARLRLGQYLFRRYGGRVVFFGRFVAVLRALAALLAGVNHMPWPRFLTFNAAGGFCWAMVYGIGGYAFGRELDRVTGPFRWVLVALAVAGTIAFLVFLRRNEEHLQAEADRALGVVRVVRE